MLRHWRKSVSEVEQSDRDEMIERHRKFVKWMNKAKQYQAVGKNIGYIRQYHPWPHAFDEYELKRAIEEGLA